MLAHPILVATVLAGMAGSLKACVDWSQLGPAVPSGAEGPGILESWNGWLVVVTDSTRLYQPSSPPQLVQTLAPVSGLAASGGLLLGWSGSGVRGWRVGETGLAEAVFHRDPLDEGWVESAAWCDGWLYVTARYRNETTEPWDWGWQETHVVHTAVPGDPQVEHLEATGLLARVGDQLLVGGCLYSLEEPGHPHLREVHPWVVNGVATSGSRVAFLSDDGHRLAVGDLCEPADTRWTMLDLEWGGIWDTPNLFQLTWVNDGVVVANINQGFVAAGRDETGTWAFCPTPGFPWMWDFEHRARDVAVAGGRLWMAEEWGHIASLPLFAPLGHVGARAQGADLVLEWDPGPGDLWTVHRCPSPTFPPGEVECLGTTKTPWFRDLRALERPAAYYRVTQGEPAIR